MLSQITDRDSSSAGSHGDLKPTGRLQESRLRLLDSSPGLCGSDLCLHHHRTHPIRLQDTTLLEDSPNFEDTLRSGRDLPIRTMVMVENQKWRSFKSSEWIKKGIEKGSLVQVSACVVVVQLGIELEGGGRERERSYGVWGGGGWDVDFLAYSPQCE